MMQHKRRIEHLRIVVDKLRSRTQSGYFNVRSIFANASTIKIDFRFSLSTQLFPRIDANSRRTIHRHLYLLCFWRTRAIVLFVKYALFAHLTIENSLYLFAIHAIGVCIPNNLVFKLKVWLINSVKVMNWLLLQSLKFDFIGVSCLTSFIIIFDAEAKYQK